jgi:hypothetical protein
MLSQSLRRLEGIQKPMVPDKPQQPTPPTNLLGALWPSLRDVHYVAHFQEPLLMNAGDVGYIKGNPPQFTRLRNVYTLLTDAKHLPRNTAIKAVRFSPDARWATQVVDGIRR